MTTKINLSNIDNEQDYSSLATTLFAKANVAANIANTALATASTILKVTSIVYPGNDTAADTAGGQTITLTGTGFVSGASVLLNGSAVGVVSVANSTTLTFTSPSANAGSYVIYIVNPDGGTAISIPGIQYSGTPTWTTAAGSLGSLYETAAFGNTVVATGDTVTYSLQSGTLPPGATFSSNGTITGTSSTLSSPTTYTFTVRATDAQNQDTDRSFSITINPDAVTWSSPTTNTSYTLLSNVAMSNISLVATSAAGANIFYSANTLPTGVSLSGNTIFGTPTVSNETRTSLLTASANTTGESANVVINWSVSVASDPYFMYNSLLLSGDGTNNAQNNTFLDGSTNNFTITRNGNTTQGTFSPYGPNWSNYFDGGGGATLVGLTNSSMTAVGTGICTVELWVNLSSTGVDQHFYDLGTNGFSIYFDFATNKFGVFNRVTSTDIFGSYSVTSNYNNWYHLAFVRSGTGTNQTAFYVNGVLSGTATNNTNFTSTSVTIGSRFAVLNSVAYGALGYLSNVRYTNTAVYSSAFTPSTAPLTAISGTRLLTCQSNRFIDNSTNAFVLTVNGAPTVQRFSPFSPTQAYSTSTIGGSGYFDGSGDSLAVPNNTSLQLLGGSFTLDCWIYLTANQTDMGIIGIHDNASVGYFIRLDTTFIRFWTSAAVADRTYSFAKNTWYHIAVVSSGTTGTLYINGVAQGATFSTNGVQDTSDQFIVGRTSNTGTNYFSGYISDVRVIKGSAVTPPNGGPTSPLTAVSGTSLLCNFTNAGIIDNTMINNLETVGNAQISTAQSKFGGGSMSFDGTGDYMIGGAFSSISRAIGSGNFTIEMWLYTNANKTQILFDTGTTSGSTTCIQCALNASGYPYVVLNNSPALTSSIVVSTGTWTHVAWVRNNGTLVIYVNGVSGGSVANSTNISDTGLTIGTPNDWRDTSSSYHYNGYIDDLRITKGYARYTSNFTPPTTAHVKQ